MKHTPTCDSPWSPSYADTWLTNCQKPDLHQAKIDASPRKWVDMGN